MFSAIKLTFILVLIKVSKSEVDAGQGESYIQAPTVEYPQVVDKINKLDLSDAPLKANSFAPGSADLANSINMIRKGSGKNQLRFYIASTKGTSGTLNPLMSAAQTRNQAWGSSGNMPTSPDWVSPASVDAKLAKTSSMQSIMTTAFKGFPYTPVSGTSYKEYAFYGENCVTRLFLMMKNGPSSSTSAGWGINNELKASTWTDLAISIWVNSGEGVSSSNPLGNAYWTIIFSTATGWNPTTKKPSRRLRG